MRAGLVFPLVVPPGNMIQLHFWFHTRRSEENNILLQLLKLLAAVHFLEECCYLTALVA